MALVQSMVVDSFHFSHTGLSYVRTYVCSSLLLLAVTLYTMYGCTIYLLLEMVSWFCTLSIKLPVYRSTSCCWLVFANVYLFTHWMQ